MGILGFGEAASGSAGTYLSGVLFDLTQSYSSAFIVGIPIAVLGTILTLFLKPPQKKAPEAK